MEKETLDLNQIKAVLGERPFKNDQAFETY